MESSINITIDNEKVVGIIKEAMGDMARIPNIMTWGALVGKLEGRQGEKAQIQLTITTDQDVFMEGDTDLCIEAG